MICFAALSLQHHLIACISLLQAVSTIDVLRATSTKFGLRVGSMKFSIQNEERRNIHTTLCTVVNFSIHHEQEKYTDSLFIYLSFHLFIYLFIHSFIQ